MSRSNILSSRTVWNLAIRLYTTYASIYGKIATKYELSEPEFLNNLQLTTTSLLTVILHDIKSGFSPSIKRTNGVLSAATRVADVIPSTTNCDVLHLRLSMGSNIPRLRRSNYLNNLTLWPLSPKHVSGIGPTYSLADAVTGPHKSIYCSWCGLLLPILES